MDSPAEKSTRSKWRKCLLLVAIFCAVVFITATGLLGYQIGVAQNTIQHLEISLNRTKKTLEQRENQVPVCNTLACITSAAQLIESMDTSVDPCQDFYQFACGGWMDQNPIPSRRSAWSQFGLLDHRVTSAIDKIVDGQNRMSDSRALNSTRDMYQACLNTNKTEELGLQPLVDLLTSYGHWPMTVANWSAQTSDWLNLSASLIRSFPQSFLIDVFNFIDLFDDPDRNMIFIDQPNLALPRSFYLNSSDPFSLLVLEDYKSVAVEAAKMIRDHLQSVQVSDEEIVNQVNEMIDFEIKLAKILVDPSQRTDYLRWNNKYKLHQLQDLTDQTNTTSAIHWTKFIRSIYSPLNISICDEEEVIVMEPDFVTKFVPLISQTPARVLVNYIHWRLVQLFGPESNEKMQLMFREKPDGVSFFSDYLAAWCRYKIYGYWDMALTAAYLHKKSIRNDLKMQMEVLIDDVKSAFVSLAQAADWLDDETKMAVREKAQAMTHVVAFPDWVLNQTLLDQHYQVEITNETHLHNVANMMKFQQKQQLLQLGKPTDRGSWIAPPYVVNAFYHGLFNSISFPVGILQPPFFATNHLKALNYAAIGSVIGHEISHGFDNNGRKRDKKGILRSWWNNATVDKYLDKAECFVQQYNNYSVAELAGSDVTHINGTQTLGENIADNGGLRQAYVAYQNYLKHNGPEAKLPGLEMYSSEQLFFIAFANIECGNYSRRSLRSRILYGVHCPGRYRVWGPVSNFDEFARHFQCPIDSPMNPSRKCVLW